MDAAYDKPRVLLLMRFNSLKRGSFEEFLIFFAKTLSEEFEIIYVFESDPPEWLKAELTRAGSVVEWCPMAFGKKARLRLGPLLRTYRPAVVHFHFFGLLSPFIPYVRWRFSSKVIVHVHSIASYDKAGSRAATFLILLRKILFVFSVHRVLTVSDFVRRNTMAQFPIRQKTIETLYNGVDISTEPFALPGGASSLRQRLDISPLSRIVFCAAWLNEIKGVHVLIRAVALLRETSDFDVTLIIAGDGPARPDLEELCRRLDVTNKVHFIGWQNQMGMLLSQADVIVVPSICEEAFSYLVLESMAIGSAIVASDIGGIPEILGRSAETALLVPPADEQALASAIRQLLDNAPLAKQLAAAAKKRSRMFTLAKQSSRLKAVYRGALDKT